jgi:hypothetical protein
LHSAADLVPIVTAMTVMTATSLTNQLTRRGDRQTLEEPWAAAAHRDETFAVPEPALLIRFGRGDAVID